MNPWQFLKRQFQHGKRDEAPEPVTRLVDMGFSLLREGKYIEARVALLRALDYQSEIQNSILLDWILTSLSKTWEETEEYQEWTEFFSTFIGRNPTSAVA